MSISSSNGQKIGLLAAAVIGINAMIGIGVVTIPAMLSQMVGPAGVLSYIISTLVVVALGIALGRVAHRYPGEGWTYLYPSAWGGHKIGMFSAVAYLVGMLVAMGFLVQQVGIWAHQFIPMFSPHVLALAIIFILMLLVLAGAEASSIGQYVIGACVTIPLVSTAAVCWLNADKALLFPFAPYGMVSILAATPKVLFALLGFECIISLYAVVKNPDKNVPRAFLISIVFVGVLYLFFTGGILSSIHPSYFAEGLNTTLSTVLSRAFPTFQLLSTAVLVGAMFGMIGTVHSMLWSTSALFTSTLKRSHSPLIKKLLERGTWNNAVSVLVSTGIMVLCSFLFKAEMLIDLTTVLLVFPTVFSILVLFFIPEEWKRGRNLVTTVGLIGGLVMFYFASQSFVYGLLSYIQSV